MKPTSTPMIEKMIHFLNSSRWDRSGTECVTSADRKRTASGMGNLSLPTVIAPGKSAHRGAPLSRLLFYLTVTLTAVEWLSEPDVPVTIKVT
jgi:hypothetical protein